MVPSTLLAEYLTADGAFSRINNDICAQFTVHVAILFKCAKGRIVLSLFFGLLNLFFL